MENNRHGEENSSATFPQSSVTEAIVDVNEQFMGKPNNTAIQSQKVNQENHIVSTRERFQRENYRSTQSAPRSMRINDTTPIE